MINHPASLLPLQQGYAGWLAELKWRATLAVNRELMPLLYWLMGRAILKRQLEQSSGTKVIDRLAKDLCAEFPEMKGLSPRNSKYMRTFVDAWPDVEFVKRRLHHYPVTGHLEWKLDGDDSAGEDK